MNIFNKKISLESSKCYLAENYPESGFYEQTQTDTKYKDNVIVDKDSGLVWGLSTNKSMLKLLEGMINEQAQGLIEDALQNKIKECDEYISTLNKSHEEEMKKLNKECEKKIFLKTQHLEANLQKLTDKSLLRSKGLSEDFALKMLSIAIKNDKVKDL